MKKHINFTFTIAILTAGLISSPAAVSAYQELTATPSPPAPTITITAPGAYLPGTRAPQNLSDLSCPADGSNPSGWGTVTPSSGWYALCSQCVNSSDWGTSTPSNTKTPNPTYEYFTQAACQTVAAGGETCYLPTSSPIATNTPFPTGTATIPAMTQNSATLTYISTTLQTCTFGGTGSLPYTLSCAPYNNGIRCDFKFTKSTTGSNQCRRPQITFSDSRGTSSQNYYIVVDSNATGGFWYQHPTINFFPTGTFSSGNAPATGLGSVNVSTTYTGTGRIIELYSSGSSSQTNSWTGSLYIQPQPVFPTPGPITATPTSTPTSGYCQSVSNTESGFSWSGISYGQTYCADIGPSEGFTFFGLTEPFGVFPWIAHVCIQDISFGDLVAFDVEISLEIILYILGFATLLRNLFIS
ncbi:MAG: hypothetical protein HUU12_02495 [Anaerolineales bacterium]|nr:hypothetical protein [Anaerolineales bacterium]NUQ58237.1 hypothetical protein [Anaerolineales bacterium]